MKRFKASRRLSYAAPGMALFLGAILSIFSSTASAALGGDCNPVAVQTCGLPFPSDLFRDSTTGKLDFPNAILDNRASGAARIGPSLKTQLSDKFTPTSIFNGSTGFSPLGPLLFELPAWPKDAIPADGTGLLRVFDMASGAEVPMIVSLSKIANPKRDIEHMLQKSPVIIAWPQTRFDFGKQYVAVLTKNLYDTSGQQMGPSVGMLTALGFYWVWPNSPADKLKSAYKPIVTFLSSKGIDRTQILSAISFTVKSETEVTKPLLDMVASTQNFTPTLSKVKSHSDDIGSKEYGAGTLQGSIELLNFRSDDGGVYPPYNPIANENLAKSDFVLTLPKWDQTGPVPIAIWGHGLANEKSVTKTAFIRNDNMGVATFAIDHPNHGSRINAESPYITALVHDPKNMMQLLGMFVQAVVDQSTVIHAATSAIPEAISKVPGAPALDGSRIVYHGLSMGAMVGSVVGAVNPELKGAYITNGAGSLMQTFSESLFWDGNTSAIIPPNASGAEETFILAMMQHYVDIVDGANFAHYYRNPPSSTPPVRLAMQYALGDGNVPNNASLATAEIAKLPLLRGDAFQAVPALPSGLSGRDGYEDDGFGILQTSYGLDAADETIQEVTAFDSNFFGGGDTTSLLSLLAKAKSLGIDVSQFSSITSLVAATGGALNSSTATSLNSLIDTLYQGDVSAFLTHFNTTPLYANISNINWYCGLLSLDTTRCDAAKKIEQDKAKTSTDPIGSIIGGLTGTGTGTTTVPTTDQIKNDIQKAIDDGKSTLSDLKVSVNNGSGGATDFPESGFLALLLLMRVRMQRIRQLYMDLAKKPAMRVLGSAFSAAAMWGSWAYIINVLHTNLPDVHMRAIKAGVGQAFSSFSMTVIGSLLLEFMFIKLFYSRYRNIITVLTVSSISLATMIFIHTLANTPRLILTVMPIYAVVLFYCSAYVKTLSALNNPTS